MAARAEIESNKGPRLLKEQFKSKMRNHFVPILPFHLILSPKKKKNTHNTNEGITNCNKYQGKNDK